MVMHRNNENLHALASNGGGGRGGGGGGGNIVGKGKEVGKVGREGKVKVFQKSKFTGKFLHNQNLPENNTQSNKLGKIVNLLTVSLLLCKYSSFNFVNLTISGGICPIQSQDKTA